jgi:hypothetical protein
MNCDMMDESWNNGPNRVAVDRQQCGKHVSAATDIDTTVEDGMWCFLCGPCEGYVTRTKWTIQTVRGQSQRLGDSSCIVSSRCLVMASEQTEDFM